MDKRKSQALPYDAKIGVIAPASPVREMAQTFRAVKILHRLGFETVLGQTTMPQRGYLAGNDIIRRIELEKFWGDQALNAIWCLRGGYGTLRLLPDLDYRMMAKHPQILIGYSDITALELALWTQIRMVTFHGPVLISLIKGREFSTNQALAMLMSVAVKRELPWPEPNTYPFSIVAGGAKGILLGGNLSTLLSLIGTNYFPNLSGALFFLEEVNESAYRIDRMLTQLLYSGALRQVAGIMIGKAVPVNGETEADLVRVYDERLGSSTIPVAYGFPFGHLDECWTLPQGILGEMDGKGSVSLGEAAVLSK